MELARFYYSAVLGVYIMISGIFAVSLFRLRIPSGAIYLSFSALTCLGLLSGLFQLEHIPLIHNSYHIIPFSEFSIILGFFVYFLMLEEELEFYGKIANAIKHGLKFTIITLGCIAFFFGLVDFRNLFMDLSPEVISGARHILGFNFTRIGTAIVIFSYSWVVAGNLYIFSKIVQSKPKGTRKLLLFGSLVSLIVSPIDLLSTSGVISFVPLFSIGYIPVILYLLIKLFSTPYFRNTALIGKLAMTHAKVKPVEDDFKEQRGNKVLLRELLKHIAAHLEITYPESKNKIDLRLSDQFYLLAEKSEMIILFHNLLEKAFLGLKEAKKGNSQVEVSCERLEFAKVRISVPAANTGWSLQGPEYFRSEQSILSKNGGDLRVERTGSLDIVELEFRK